VHVRNCLLNGCNLPLPTFDVTYIRFLFDFIFGGFVHVRHCSLNVCDLSLPTFDAEPVKYIRFFCFFLCFWRVWARLK